LSRFDDTLIGTACDDGDACTVGETYDSNCGCSGGVFQDADNDGVCDANDVCPGFDDTLIGTACDDGDACTVGETYDSNCGCSGGVFQDTDNDGVCDANDQCPGFDDTLIGQPVTMAMRVR
jgi:Ni,Fe-hydrogenase III small subunit